MKKHRLFHLVFACMGIGTAICLLQKICTYDVNAKDYADSDWN